MLRLELDWNHDRSGDEPVNRLSSGQLREVLRCFGNVVQQMVAEDDAQVKALFAEPGTRISRLDLAQLRDRRAAAEWDAGPMKISGALSLRRMHNDSCWGELTESDDQDLVSIPRNLVLLDALDFMVAAMGPEDSLRVSGSRDASKGAGS